MKIKSAFSILLLLIAIENFSQTTKVAFHYDNSGNRVLTSLSVEKVADSNLKTSELVVLDSITCELGKIRVYPNPTDGFLSISIPESIEKLEYVLFDPKSITIKTGVLPKGNSVLDISTCNTGVYLLKVVYRDKFVTFRIIKK